jgi:reactive chlorine resistance protein C
MKLLEWISSFFLRYSLVTIITWIGCLKFYKYEMEGVMTLVQNSPVLSWLQGGLENYQISAIIGIIEIIIAFLIGIKFISTRLSIFGSLGAIMMFSVTLSFFATTKGVIMPEVGRLALSGGGQSLLKDVCLLAIAFWTLNDTLKKRLKSSSNGQIKSAESVVDRTGNVNLNMPGGSTI